MIPSLLRSFALSALLSGSVLGRGLVVHDDTFVPDHVLYVSAQNISQACNNRYSTVINGTSPGPPIRLRPGRSAWIRVFNLVPDANLTMASSTRPHLPCAEVVLRNANHA